MHPEQNQSVFPIILQQSHNDCGPACLKSMALYYGREFDIGGLDDIGQIMKHGMTLYDMRRELKRMGLDSLPIKCSVEELASVPPLPAIALLNNRHYVTICDADAARVSVADPVCGPIDVDYDLLRKVWYTDGENAGILLVVGDGEAERSE